MIIGDPICIASASALPLSLAELKSWLRFDLDDEDATLAGLIRAATELVERYAGLSLITSTWTQTFSAFASPMRLGRRPLQSVNSVTYLDSGAIAQTLDTAIYRVTGVTGDRAPGAIRLVYGAAWPAVLDDAEAVTVTFQSGFGDDHNAVPESIRLAIAMAASTHFSYREDVVTGANVSEELPFASRALLRSWRPLAVA